MKISYTKVLALFAATAIVEVATADVAKVEVMYVNGFSFLDPLADAAPLLDAAGVPLSAGGTANDDGAIFQVGFFEGVSHLLSPSAFSEAQWSSFRPLTGIGSPNAERHPTSIGAMDSRRTGPFGFLWYPSAVAIELDPQIDQDVPTDGLARLGVRFYDGTSIEASTAYNIVTSDELDWLLHAPEPTPSSNSVLNMDVDPLFWASGLDGTFQTSIQLDHMPEPGSASLLLVGALVMLRRRR